MRTFDIPKNCYWREGEREGGGGRGRERERESEGGGGRQADMQKERVLYC